MPAPLDCLGVGAHPDDMEILAGGFLALLKRQGHRTAILDLSRGERGSNGTAVQRERERRAAARVLGLSSRPCLGLPDSALQDDLPSRRRLARAIRALRPALILGMPLDDHHPDHRAAADLVFGACWLAGLAKAPGIPGRPFRPRAVLHCVGLKGEPDILVDVSPAWEDKLRAMRCYRSQFTGKGRSPLTFIDRPGFLEAIEARGALLGFRIGARRAEGFRTRGPLVTKDPMRLLADGTAPR